MKKKLILFLILCFSLCGCSFSSEHNIVSISDASMNDMVVEMNGVTIQLYQTLSTLLEDKKWNTKDIDLNSELDENESKVVNVYSENNLIIETKVMNTGKGKMKVQDALLQEIHPINVIDFTLPEAIRIGTDFNTVIEKYGIPNIYMHNKNGDYQITYICSKNVDIKNIMELHFENNVLANVRLQGKLSRYEMFTTSSFQIDKALGYKPYIDITGIEKIDKIALDNASFQIDDLILTSETSIMELLENGWIIKNLDIDNTFSYMKLEKNNFEIYVAFDKIYESVADMDVNTKIAIIRLNDNAISLYKLNGKEKPTMDDVVAAYGTPNEIYYDAGETVVAYYTNDKKGKIIFYADVSHSLKEIRILNTQPFHGIEKGWNNI